MNPNNPKENASLVRTLRAALDDQQGVIASLEDRDRYVIHRYTCYIYILYIFIMYIYIYIYNIGKTSLK